RPLRMLIRRARRMSILSGRPDLFDALAIGTEIQRRIGVKTSRDEPLGRFTTIRLGGPADLFAVAHNAFELRKLVQFARSRGLAHTILGRGSDVLIADAGIRGLVIQDRAEGIEIAEQALVAEAGVPMARAATVSQAAGLSGLEFGLAIPGTVGGAVWANAGAHDSTVAAVLAHGRVLAADGGERQLTPAELGLGYRDSQLKHPGPAGVPDVVLGATFQLEPASAVLIKERLDEIKRWRQDHQPLGTPSAGSWFRNPLPDSAGALIDEAGLKGLRIGGVSVSEKHANFLVNDQKGNASDLRRLSDRVRAAVEARTGIRLVEEIVYLGDWGDWQPEAGR
ncbi:MAG: UDP-N-acetylmuramate dehydrogenase, partial [Candidatus Limnocylindrales bacterium]